MKKDKSYKDGLKIDRYQLDRELEQQPQLYMDWALKSAEAADDKDWEKQRLDIVRAKAEQEVRKNPKKYGIENTTEGAVKAAITCHPKVRRQTKKYLIAVKNDRILTKAESAYKARQKMLEKLAERDIRLQFAEVKVPTAYKEKRVDDSKKLLRKEMKKKRSGK